MSRARPKISERLRAAGRRITPERELLLRIIERNAHLDATEIHRLARSVNPRIGLATVYRTLSLLGELDMIRSCGFGEDHSHYEVRQTDHVHLICIECGRVIDAPYPDGLRSLTEREGFAVRQSRLELLGVCDRCRADCPEEPEGPE